MALVAKIDEIVIIMCVGEAFIRNVAKNSIRVDSVMMQPMIILLMLKLPIQLLDVTNVMLFKLPATNVSMNTVVSHLVNIIVQPAICGPQA